jgi:superfamily II DNA or RNA helicase
MSNSDCQPILQIIDVNRVLSDPSFDAKALLGLSRKEIEEIHKGLPAQSILPVEQQRGTSFDLSPTSRPVKEITRHIVAQALVDRKQKKKRLLAFPGSTGRDIEILKYYGGVDIYADWYLVERDAEILSYFSDQSYQKRLFDLHDERVHYINKAFAQVEEINLPLDFAWLDFYGNLTWGDLANLSEVSGIPMVDVKGRPPDADFFFTFSHTAIERGVGDILIKEIKRAFFDASLGQKLGVQKYLIEDFEGSLLPETPTDATGPCGHWNYPYTRSCEMDESILIQWQLLKYIFLYKHNLCFDATCYIYNDEGHQDMLLYHLRNFKYVKNPEIPSGDAIEVIKLIRKLFGNSDEKIANLVNEFINEQRIQERFEGPFVAADIKHFKILNDIPIGTKAFARFDDGEQLENNLYATIGPNDLLAPTQQLPALIEALKEFNPFIDGNWCRACGKKHPALYANDVSLRKSSDGPLSILTITTPRSKKFPGKRYQIRIDQSEEPRTLYLSSYRIQITPQFLHPANRVALESVFRILFRGDEYLHPQLCQQAPICFEFSDPQRIAIIAFEQSLVRGEDRGAVILPTGMGKTIVAMQILQRYIFGKGGNYRILFLSHRRAILNQAIKSFIRPKYENEERGPDRRALCRLEDVGILYGSEDAKAIFTEEESRDIEEIKKAPLEIQINRPFVFSSISTFSNKLDDLQSYHEQGRLHPNHFSFIIVDEFHHAPSDTWERVISFLIQQQPDYLLGLTATPFRYDEQPVLNLLGYNELYRMDLGRACWQGYLSFPEYYWFQDISDYIPGRAPHRQRDPEFLKEQTYLKYQEFKLDKQPKRPAKKTLFFMNSVAEAVAFNEYFQERGVRSEALYTSGVERILLDRADCLEKPGCNWDGRHCVCNYNLAPRERSSIQERFALPTPNKNALDVLFVKDYFNEGVDIPDIDAIFLIRKTESAVKHFQQIGRGLRLSKGKRKLIIVDLINNYRTVRNAIPGTDLSRVLLEVTEFLRVFGYQSSIRGEGGEGEPRPPLPPGTVAVQYSDEAEASLANAQQHEMAEKEKLWWRHLQQLAKNLDNPLEPPNNTRLKEICPYSSLTPQRTVHDYMKQVSSADLRPQEKKKMFRRAFEILYATMHYIYWKGSQNFSQKNDVAGFRQFLIDKDWHRYDFSKELKVPYISTEPQFDLTVEAVVKNVPLEEYLNKIVSTIEEEHRWRRKKKRRLKRYR